jgi:type IV pilus biogenesis protein CpaD/CtpE
MGLDMRIATTFGLILIAAGLSGCSVNSDSWVNQERLEVRQNHFTDTFETATLTDEKLRAIGVHYYRFGNGPMDVVISYDPKSRVNTAGRAEHSKAKIEKALRVGGVKDLRIRTVGSPGSGDASKTVVTFAALVASAPQGCGMMPGYETSPGVPENGEDTPDYMYGCTVEALMARQVSRPGDLLGRPGFETNADGRRQETVVGRRGYYSDSSNKPLGGESASGSK